MPRKFTVRNFQPNTLYHIYNEEANHFNIFQDDEDKKVFTDYLSDYLTPPPEKDDLKVTVEFQGKKLTGVPRQPNNYHGDLELLAYCITPRDFHLVLYQNPSHVIAKFMQSMTTRYSMYFNKRHDRTGSPFRGKYKAVGIGDGELLLLTHYLHRKGWADDAWSSQPIVAGETQVDWLNPEPIQDFFFREDTKKCDLGLLQDFINDDRVDSASELGELRLDE